MQRKITKTEKFLCTILVSILTFYMVCIGILGCKLIRHELYGTPVHQPLFNRPEK